MEPNAEYNGVPVVSLRDEPWEEALAVLTDAINHHWLFWHLDDGLMLSRVPIGPNDHVVDPNDPLLSLDWAEGAWWVNY